MSVLVSNGATTIGTTNGFLRSDAYNVSVGSSNGSSVGNYGFHQALTFANTGNCNGAIIGYSIFDQYTIPNSTYSLKVSLDHMIGNPTISNASPAVITLASHGLANLTRISFTTTGGLPSGLTVNQEYFVRNTATNTFNISLTPAGALINTGSAGSGTHSLWVDVADCIKTIATLFNNVTCPRRSFWSKDFPFTTPVAINTNASEWRLSVSFMDASATPVQTSGSPLSLLTSDGTNLYYYTYSNNTVTYSDTNDMIVCKDIVQIDGNFNPKPYLGTGNTNDGVCVTICSNATTGNYGPTGAYLQWASSPAASYTFTLSGIVQKFSHSGISVGTSSSRNANSKQAIITPKTTATVGTRVGFKPIYGDNNNGARDSFWFYGEIPVFEKTTLTQKANIGDTVLKLSSTTGLFANDYITFAKITAGSTPSTAQTLKNYIIQSVDSPTQVTLTSAITNLARETGSLVFRTYNSVTGLDYYGIKFTTDNTTNNQLTLLQYQNFDPINCVVSGCAFENVNVTSTMFMGKFEDSANKSMWIWEHSQYPAMIPKYGITNIQYQNFPFGQFTPPAMGVSFQYLNIVNSGIAGNMQGSVPAQNSTTLAWEFYGKFVIQYCNFIEPAQSMGNYMAFSCIIDWNNNVFDGMRTYWYSQSFNGNISNNSVWGYTGSGQPTFFFAYPNVNLAMNNNTFNQCYQAIKFAGAATNSLPSAPWTNNTFGNLVANTTDIVIGGYAYVNVELFNELGNITIDTSGQTTLADNSRFTVTNANQVANVDYDIFKYGKITRTGTALADTTSHNGGFAMRFESNNGSNALTWIQNVPTGNIQNKTMSVGVWVNINSANYYSGTYQIPRITVNYDNGSVVYGQAAAATGWQYVFVSFTPLTTYGQISVTLSAQTDQTSTNGYAYFDDISVLYPAGVQLNLGNMDLWANGFPVTPSIATNLSAADVWAADYTKFGANTIGQALSPVATGTATAGSANTITLQVGASSTNNLYQYDVIQITGGTGAGQARFIASYVGSTRVATLYSNWAVNPDSSSVYSITAMGSIEHAVWDALTANHTVSGSEGLQANGTAANAGIVPALL